jgi:hypothetical protein
MKKTFLLLFQAILMFAAVGVFADDDFITSAGPGDAVSVQATPVTQPKTDSRPAMSPTVVMVQATPADTPGSASIFPNSSQGSAVPVTSAAAVEISIATPVAASGTASDHVSRAATDENVKIDNESQDNEGIVILSPGQTEPAELEKFIEKKKIQVEPEKRTNVDYSAEEEGGLNISYGEEEEEGAGEVLLVEGEGQGRVRQTGYVLVEKAGFISDNFEEDGFLYTFENKDLLSQGDSVYVKLTVGKGIRKGTELMIYDDSELITSKYDDSFAGKLIKVRGVARVVEKVQDNIWKTKIIKSYDIIHKNEKIKVRKELKDYASKLSMKIKSRTKEAAGHILKAQHGQIQVSNRDIVYIDIGLDQGILPGDRLDVIRETENTETGAPDRYDVLGKIMVINSMKKSSVAMVIEQTDILGTGMVVKTTGK